MTELTKEDRLNFASEKLTKALKWMMLSGTATFFLTGLLDIVKQVQLPYWATLLVYLFINTTIYGVAEYVKGESDK